MIMNSPMATELPITAKRLRWVMSETDWSQEDLADAVGTTQGAISLILVGKTRNSRFISKIAATLGVNLDWLMGISDELIWMYDEDGRDISEDDLARIKAGKSTKKLQNPNAGVESASSDYHAENELLPMGKQQAKDMGIALIPELELGYSMGGGNVIELFEHTGVAPFKREWLRPMMKGSFDELFVAKGEGDSMIPTMLDGDIVLIDTAQKNILQQDRIWALSYGDLGMIKRVRKLPDGGYQINSDNPAVTPMTAYDGEMHVIGRVIWVGRRM